MRVQLLVSPGNLSAINNAPRNAKDSGIRLHATARQRTRSNYSPVANDRSRKQRGVGTDKCVFADVAATRDSGTRVHGTKILQHRVMTDRNVHIDDRMNADFRIHRNHRKRSNVSARADLNSGRQNSRWMYECRCFPPEFLRGLGNFSARPVFANGGEKPQLTAFENVACLFNASMNVVPLMLRSALCRAGIRVPDDVPSGQMRVCNRACIDVPDYGCHDRTEPTGADNHKFAATEIAGNPVTFHKAKVALHQPGSLFSSNGKRV